MLASWSPRFRSLIEFRHYLGNEAVLGCEYFPAPWLCLYLKKNGGYSQRVLPAQRPKENSRERVQGTKDLTGEPYRIVMA